MKKHFLMMLLMLVISFCLVSGCIEDIKGIPKEIEDIIDDDEPIPEPIPNNAGVFGNTDTSENRNIGIMNTIYGNVFRSGDFFGYAKNLNIFLPGSSSMGKLKGAIYRWQTSDKSLLGVTEELEMSEPGWNNLSFTISIPIQPNDYYLLAVHGDSPGMGVRYQATGTTLYAIWVAVYSDFPSNWENTGTNAGRMSLYCYYDDLPFS